MIRLIIAILAIATLSAGNVFAQGKYGADSAECIKYLSYYKEYFKQKNYDSATPNWREAFRICPPTANQTMLVDGTALMRKLISKNAKNPVYKAQLIDSLMMVHDVRIEYYPKYGVTARNNKGLDMANYIKDDNKRLYDGLNEIIEFNDRETKPSLYIFDLNAAIELCKIGMIDEEEVISVYERNSSLLDAAEAKTEADREANEKVRTDLDNLFVASKLADCDKIIALYGPRFEADPSDTEFASKVVRIMSSAEDCMDNKLFIAAATTVYNANPSSSSAKMLYQLNAAQGKVDLAIKYMEEAIAAEDSDAETDADYYYELAVYCYKSGRPQLAESSAKRSVATTSRNDLKAKNYMLLATVWGNVRCEGNEIAVRAPYWVAVDYLEKAKRADASLSEEANKMIGQFRQYYPTAADAFMYDVKDGDSYTVSCGAFRETTTVKTQK
ncbi:MAG: hypothetical protein J5740_00675 [Bacteroidales bacterium]|nr:hypothetical protein [Bacteroidales bacterium]